MKKLIVVFYLCILPFLCVYPQSGVNEDCNSIMESIFEVLFFRNKYELVQYIITA